MKTIEITVATDGTTKVEANGFTGSSCREASKFIRDALGKSRDEKLKSEFYLRNDQQQRSIERS